MTVEHVDAGPYALGLLEEADRRAFERHLAGCAECRAAVNDFSGLTGLLRGVEPVGSWTEDIPDTGPPVVELLSRRRREDRRRRRATYILSAAAGIALLATGAFVGADLAGDDGGGTVADPHDAHHSPAAALLKTGERHSATDARTGAAGTVSMESKDWGTHVAMDLRNIRGPLACRLVAITRSGEREPVTSWIVPREGYGVPGSPDPLQIHGGAKSPRDDIARFEVDIEGGGTLLTVPV